MSSLRTAARRCREPREFAAGSAFGSSISADGRLVAFDSIATNLVPGYTNTCTAFCPNPGECPDVFVHDRLTGGHGA